MSPVEPTKIQGITQFEKRQQKRSHILPCSFTKYKMPMQHELKVVTIETAPVKRKEIIPRVDDQSMIILPQRKLSDQPLILSSN